MTSTTNTTAWKLAETYLGDGQRWKEVLDLNRGTRLTDGTTFTQGTQTIPTGSTLRLPADATVNEEKKQSADAPKPTSRVVVTGDTLWDITEDELGDPFRYPEVFEASTDTVQPGGERLTDPDLIKPGWTITIPATRTADPDQTDEPTKPAKPVERKPATQADQTPVKPVPEPSPETPAAQTHQSPPVPTGDPPVLDDQSDVQVDTGTDKDTDDAESDSILNAPWILSGLTGAGVLLAGGLYRGLRQRRAAQLRHRRPGRAVATPGPELAGAEMTISAAGRIGEDPLTYLDHALRRLAGTTHANSGSMPAVAAVELTADTAEQAADDGRVTLHLSEPGDLPQPWQPTPDRLHWHVPGGLPVDHLGDLSDEADAPYPLLVTIGEGDDGALWLLNCEDLGTLTLAGDPDRTRDFARHLVAQLAVNPWSLGVTVDCIGIAAEAEPLGDRIHHHPTPTDAAAATAEALADAVTMVDRATGHDTDVATGRTGQHDDDIWPARLLLLDTKTDEPEGLAALLELIETHPGRTATSIVLTGERPDTAGIHLHLTPEGRVVLEQAGLDLIAVGLTSEETSGVGLVYAQAEVLDDVPIPVDETADNGWEAYADRSGALRREHTLPRATPDTELTEPAVTLLDADDSEYVEHAAVVPEDLDALAPKIPGSLRREVEAHLPTLDRDLADWYDEDSRRAKITLLGPVAVRTHGKPLAKNRPLYTELAAFLWLHRRTGVTREQVTTYFGTPTNRVRYRMSDLRGWLGDNPLTGRPYLPNSSDAPSTQEHRHQRLPARRHRRPSVRLGPVPMPTPAR